MTFRPRSPRPTGCVGCPSPGMGGGQSIVVHAFGFPSDSINPAFANSLIVCGEVANCFATAPVRYRMSFSVSINRLSDLSQKTAENLSDY